MKVLVTGGSGYIGGHLVQKLLDLGHYVRILDTGFNSNPWDFRCNPAMLGRVAASVTNQDAVGRAMQQIDMVYHLAGRMDWCAKPNHPIKIIRTNTVGTATVLSESLKAGITNVVTTSSAAVYGDVVGADEVSITFPVDEYGASKLAADALVWAFSGVEVKVLRPFNVWGRRFSRSVVSLFAKGEKPEIFGSGDQTRDFVFIDDVVDALVRAAAWEPAVYNIGTGHEVTVEGLWRLLRDDAPAFSQPIKPNEVFRSCADMSWTLSRTNWKPQTILSELSREEIIKLCE